MASGMGMPSIGIYSYELSGFYGVENIIRVGTAGMLSQKLKVRDIVLGKERVHEQQFRPAVRFPRERRAVLFL